jgi:ankyrin repeat protein
LAAYEGHLDVVKELIKAGADVNVKDVAWWTSLHLAICEGHLEMEV